MDKKHIIITEYGYLAPVNEEIIGIHLENNKINHYIDKKLYKHIIKWNDFYNKKDEKNPVFKVESRKVGKDDKSYRTVLVAQNQIGTIQFGNIVIDIIPKTFFVDNVENKEKENIQKIVYDKLKESNNLLLKMLRYTKFPKLNLLNADLQNSSLPILEIFILSFINELNLLIKQGILSGYVEKEFNSKYFKGKPLWQQHINKNLVNKVIFYIRTTLFTTDRAENRLIKATIIFLIKISNSYNNIMTLRQLLTLFENVNIKNNCKTEFLNVKNNRNTKYYQDTLRFCDLFLCKKNSPFGSGDKYNTFSFLFNMEKIFEDYVPIILRVKYKQNIETQIEEESLIVHPKKKFSLKPDIICKKNCKEKYIADTKWKIINAPDDISQSDIYQMFAYVHKYEINTVYLIYPKTNNSPKTDNSIKAIEYSFDDDNQKKLIISFFDLDKDEWIK